MIVRTEMITLHILDLLQMLDASNGSEGSLRLLVDGEEQADVPFEDLCLVVRIDDRTPASAANIIPLRPIV